MRIGTRASRLARWQAHHIAARLVAAGLGPVEVIEMTTTGDRVLDLPLAEIGSKGLFTDALDRALLDGRVDLAVHSLKDLPTVQPDGLALAAVTEREDPRDAFVAHPDVQGGLAELPVGAVLATSSLRRAAQLRAWRPDLRTVPVRGNVPTRIEKLDASGAVGERWDGVILAAAGLVRLGLDARIRERIATDVMLPAVGQGALGIVCVAARADLVAQLDATLGDAGATAATAAERALLRRLEGGCQVPVGAWGRVEASLLVLDGSVTSLDGAHHVRACRSGAPADAETLGIALAEHLLAQGAGAILDAIRGVA